MKLSLLLIGCIICSPALADNPLPPILDFYPQCVPQVINTASNKIIYDIDPALATSSTSGVMAHREMYLQRALVDIQRQAQIDNADAVIIQRLNVTGVDRSINLQDSSGKVNSNIKQIHVSSTVEHLKLCDDKQLTANSTPYNSKGKAVSFTETVVKLALPEDGSLFTQAQKHSAPDAAITIDSAYGVHIGDSVDGLQSALGPHSIQLQLSDGTIAYGYGRNLWFFVKNAYVVMISQDPGLVNNHGKNQIALSENYDNDDWIIEGKIHPGDKQETVAKYLLLNKHNGDYRVTGKNSQLILQFEDYNESITKAAVSRLNRFAIMPLVDASHKPQVNFANFDNIDIAKIIALDHKQTYTLQPQQLVNQIQLNENGPKAIVNSNVLLGFNEQGTINSLKVTESMFEPQDIDEFKKVLATYQIPTTKTAFLARYPDAEDNFDNVMITKGTILMSVNFDSYDDDAELIDLSIVF